MAYVAVKGGEQAIEESLRRLKYERVKKGAGASVDQIEQGMRLLVDQVMSEGSLYDPSLAALAIKQGEGSMEEAVFLLRSYRSTLPRRYYSHIIDSREMEVERRISAAFKDIPQGQLLGTSYDYVHRLLDFDLLQEREEELKKYVEAFLSEECTKEKQICAFQGSATICAGKGCCHRWKMIIVLRRMPQSRCSAFHAAQ